MADVRNVQLGTCTVKRAATDLGHTIGGTTIKYKPDIHTTELDAYGSTSAEQFVVGEELGAECALAEYTLANLLISVPKGTAVADDSFSIGGYAGKKLSTNAATWVFHPIVNSATNYNDDWTIYKGVVTNEIKIEHKNDGEKTVPIEVNGLVDEGRSDGNLLGFFGDSIS